MTLRKLTYINSGEPVSAEVANRPLRQLEQRTNELFSKFNTTDAGNTLIAREVPCDSAVRIGMPVYWDSEEQCCKPAYLNAELSSLTQEYLTGTPADCIGLVCHKNSALSVDLLLSGLVDFPIISDYLHGETGRFYLGVTPGSLSCKASSHAFPLGVVIGPMGPCDTEYKVYFNPSYTNTVLQHQHFKVDLAPVFVEDTETAGWRLIDEFEDAPDEAIYVYNCEADSKLSKVWPPIPLEAISATADWASETESIGGKELTINEDTSLLLVREDGIYWTSDALVPFNHTANPNDPFAHYKHFRVTLNFSKVRYSNRNNFVTSLQPEEYQPFEFVDCKGHTANSGDLYARFTLKDNEVESTNFDGRSLKCFTDKWESEMVSTVNGIKVTGNGAIPATTPHFSHNGSTYYKGLINLDLSPFAPDTELAPQIIKVGAAQEREVYGITYLGLPAGRSSSLRLKFEIPANYANNKIDFYLRMQCIATIPGPYATATVKYYKVARAVEPQELRGLESTAEIIECDFAKDGISADKMFEVNSESITVDPGDTVIVVISRDSSLSYNADLAIARIHGILNIKKEEEDNAS